MLNKIYESESESESEYESITIYDIHQYSQRLLIQNWGISTATVIIISFIIFCVRRV